MNEYPDNKGVSFEAEVREVQVFVDNTTDHPRVKLWVETDLVVLLTPDEARYLSEALELAASKAELRDKIEGAKAS